MVGDGVTFTTIHMPLVRTPMIAPTKMYDALPGDHPGGGGGHDLRGDARRPKQMDTRLGHVRRGALRARPRSMVDQMLHIAYKRVPGLGSLEGSRRTEEHVSIEQIAMATLKRASTGNAAPAGALLAMIRA